MSEKRTKMDIIYDILIVLKKNPNIKRTHLIYKTNLSHVRLLEYLEYMSGKGIIQEFDSNIIITETGEKLIEEYKKMRQFMDGFGI